MIELLVSAMRSDGSRVNSPADAFVGVTGRLELLVDEVSLYTEEDFPVVELAAELCEWLRTGFETGQDFEFDSMSTPEPGWVWIRRVATGWRVGSVYQDRIAAEARTDAEVSTAVERFIDLVKTSALSQLGADISPYLEPSAC